MNRADVVKLLDDCGDEFFMLHIVGYTDFHAAALQKNLEEKGYEVVLTKTAFSNCDIIVTGRNLMTDHGDT